MFIILEDSLSRPVLVMAKFDSIELGIELFRQGRPVLIYDSDDREGEVDIVYPAEVVTPDDIALMRQMAGGLICFATRYEIGHVLGLELQTRILKKLNGLADLVKLPSYGDEPAFSLWVNHVKVRTGIRDTDRALTIRELSRIVKMIQDGNVEQARREFLANFYSPGHVPILLGRVGTRYGHTELSLMLAELAGCTPAIVLCEVLGSSREAASVDECRELARKLNTVLLAGSDIVKLYEQRMRT